MSTLYLHIGSNKTATTAIQDQLRQHSDSLQDIGICYPRTGRTNGGAHHLLCFHFIEKQFLAEKGLCREGRLPDYLGQLRPEIQGPDTTIISSESLFFFHRIEKARLKHLLDLFDQVRIIMYLRRQDSFALSFFKSRLKNGDALHSFEDFCRSWDLNYFKNARNWEEFAGEGSLIVRPYVEKAWRGANIITDFFYWTGAGSVADSLTEPQRINESLSLPVLDVLRYTNHLKIKERTAFLKLIKKIGGNLTVPEGEGYLTTALQAELLSRYDDSNRRLAGKYWTPEEAEAFTNQFVEAAAKPYQGLNSSQWATIIAGIWEDRPPST